jgi:hypothetical protein
MILSTKLNILTETNSIILLLGMLKVLVAVIWLRPAVLTFGPYLNMRTRTGTTAASARMWGAHTMM